MADDDTTQTAVADDEWDYKPAPKAKGSSDDEWDYHPAQRTATLPAGSYQTKPGGPILNRAGITAQTPKLNEEGPITRAAGAFNEAVGAPRSFAAAAKEPPPSIGRTLLHAVPGFDAAEMAASAYKGMKDTSDYADQYPWGSSANIYNKAESLIPFVGPAISAAARKGAEDERGFTHALPEMAGTAAGLGVGIASGDPEARESILSAPQRLGENLAERRLTKAAKEAKEAAPPGRHEINYNEQFNRARPYLAEEQRAQPMTTVREGYEGANQAIQNIEQKVGSYIDAFPQDTVNGGDVLARAEERLRNPDSPRTPQEIERGIKALQDFGITENMPLKAADRLRWRFNRDMDSEMGMTEADRADVRASNPVFAAKEAAAEALRDAVYQKLEDRGVQGVRELRGDEGAVMQMRDAFRRNINRAEKSNAPSAARRLGVFGPIGLGFLGETVSRHLGVPPGVSAGLGVGSAGLFEWYRNRMRPNPLMERAMGRLGKSDLAPSYPEIPNAPPIRGELPPPATAAGYPAEDTSGTVRGGRYTTPRGLVGEEPPIEAEFLPRRVPVQPERAGIGRMLPERTGPETTVPPDVEEPFRREGTGRPDDERTLAGQRGIRQPVRGLLPEAAGQTTPKEPIGRPIRVNPEARTLGRKGLGEKKPVESTKPKGNPWKTGKSSTDVPDYVKAAAKEAGAMTAGYQADAAGHPGMGTFMFSDTARGGTFNIPEGQVTARAIREKMEARAKAIEPSPLVDEKVENTKREMARREAAEAIPPAPTKTAQEEFSPEQIEDAEYAVRNELEMRQSADKPGRYPIIESREGNTNPNWQQIVGWRGVGGWKGLQWTKGFTPKEVETALRRRAGKTYDELIRRAARPQEEVEKAGSFNPEELEKPPVRAKQ